MTNYNTIVGLDEQALRTFVQEAYQAAHPALFSGSIQLGEEFPVFTRLDYDVAEAPDVSLTNQDFPADVMLESMLDDVDAQAELTFEGMMLDHPDGDVRLEDNGLNAAAEDVTGASFGLTANRVVVTIHGDSGNNTQLEVSLSAGLFVDVSPDRTLVLRLLTLTLSIPGGGAFDELLNDFFAPFLRDKLNTEFFASIKIPPLELEGVSLAPPTVRASDGQLIASSALSGPSEPAPTDGGWPQGKLFVGADLEMLNALAAVRVPKLPKVEEQWSKTWKFIVGQITLRVTVEAKITELEIGFVPGNSGQLEGKFRADAFARGRVKLGSLSGRGSVRGSVRIQPEIIDGYKTVGLRLMGIGPLDVDLDFNNVNNLIDNAAEELVESLSSLLSPKINEVIASQAPIKIGELPSILVPISGKNLNFSASDVSISKLTTADGKDMLLAAGIPRCINVGFLQDARAVALDMEEEGVASNSL